jgi:hypothetical protein
MSMDIDFSVLKYSFIHKPLLVGGKSMEYYGLRKAGADIDLIIHPEDHSLLKKQYPDHVKDLYGDIGICEFGFEIWNHISNLDYEYLSEKAIEEPGFLVISLEKALILKALAMHIPKYYKDLELLTERIRDNAYGIHKRG